MKKIFIASYSLVVGGIEKSLINFLKSIDFSQYQVILLLQDKKGELLKQIPEQVNIIEYKISKSRFVPWRKLYNRLHLLYFEIRNCKKYHKSICYATYDIPSSHIVKKVGKESILWIHSDYVNAYHNEENKIRNFYDTRKLRLFDRIIFVSEEAKKNLLVYYPDINDKSLVINNLFDAREIIEKARTGVAVPQKKGMQTLVFVGRLEEESKGVSKLLKIMKEFQKDHRNINLWIVGDGPSKDEYEEYQTKNKLRNVIFFGQQDNPYPYLKNADLMVLPSNYEGFPVVCLEALTLGKKIVTTIDVSTGSFKLHDYAWVVNNNIEEIEKGIEVALKQDVKKKFSYDKFNDDTKKKILKLLGE